MENGEIAFRLQEELMMAVFGAVNIDSGGAPRAMLEGNCFPISASPGGSYESFLFYMLPPDII